jgi:hypothetical protein
LPLTEPSAARGRTAWLHCPDDAQAERARLTSDAALLLCRAPHCWLAHDCGSWIECVVVTPGDRRILRCVQPAYADARLPARRAAVP